MNEELKIQFELMEERTKISENLIESKSNLTQIYHTDHEIFW